MWSKRGAHSRNPGSGQSSASVVWSRVSRQVQAQTDCPAHPLRFRSRFSGALGWLIQPAMIGKRRLKILLWLCLASGMLATSPTPTFLPVSDIPSVHAAVVKARFAAKERRDEAERHAVAAAGVGRADVVGCEAGFDCRGGKCVFEACTLGGLVATDGVGCSGGKCVFRDCDYPSCRGGGCVFVRCTHPSCDGGKCHFVDTPTTLSSTSCTGGSCMLDGWALDVSSGRLVD